MPTQKMTRQSLFGVIAAVRFGLFRYVDIRRRQLLLDY